MKPTDRETRRRESRYSIEALARGLDVLHLFTAHKPSLTLAEIGVSLDLNKSTIFRILATLETTGYLERDPVTRCYSPSLKVLQLGFSAINRLDVRQVARPYLERLAQELNETVSLCVLHGSNVIYIDRVRNRAIVGVILDIGSHLPAHCTTVGKVLLADLPTDEIEKVLDKLQLMRYTQRTITEREAFLAELSAIRKSGFAVSNGELAVGLRAAGAPIRDISGKTVAAINGSGSSSTISLHRLRKEIAPAVVKTAAQISLALGYGSGTMDKKMG